MLDQAESDLEYLVANKRRRPDVSRFSVVESRADDGGTVLEPLIDYKRLHAACTFSKAIDTAEAHLPVTWLTPTESLSRIT